MYRFTRFSFAFLLLATGGFFLAACNAEPEQPEAVEDAIEAREGPIEEEMQQELGLYDTWDTDRDTRLTATEFNNGVGTGTWWNDWDTDADNYLSNDEFNTAYANETWYTPDTYGTWDTNGDNLLDQNEWNTGLFDTWDANDDTYLTADEYDDGLFDNNMM